MRGSTPIITKYLPLDVPGTVEDSICKKLFSKGTRSTRKYTLSDASALRSRSDIHAATLGSATGSATGGATGNATGSTDAEADVIEGLACIVCDAGCVGGV